MSKILFQKALINIAFALFLATPVATALSRNIALPVLLFATVLFSLAPIHGQAFLGTWATLREATLQTMTSTAVGRIASATIAFALASLLWSPSVDRGLGAVAQVTAAALAASVCCILISRHLSAPSWLVWALPLFASAACVLILTEFYFGFPMRSALGASTEPFRLNRAAVALALLLPVLFIHVGSRTGLLAAVVVGVLIVATVFRSESESAKLAVFAIVIVSLFSHVLKGRVLALTVGALLLGSHILAPAIAILLYKFVTPEAVASLSSALTTHPYHFIRLEIWWAYAQQIAAAPLFGHGMQASYQALETYQGSDPIMLKGLQFIHPHNASIQTWYELGLVGVLLTAGLITFILHQILLLSERSMRMATIIMAGVWSVAYVSHGAWQGWWWALVGIVAALLAAISKANGKPAT